MSGVVASGGGDSLITFAAEGGDAFAKRLKDLKAAEDSLTKAYQALGIGKDAAAEYDKAAALRKAAEDLLASAKTQARDIVDAAAAKALTNEQHVAALHKEATDTAARTAADSERLMAEAREAAAALVKEGGEQTKAASRLMASAVTEMDKAEALMATAVEAQRALDARAARIDAALTAALAALKE